MNVGRGFRTETANIASVENSSLLASHATPNDK
jgi:hypothetical protein